MIQKNNKLNKIIITITIILILILLLGIAVSLAFGKNGILKTKESREKEEEKLINVTYTIYKDKDENGSKAGILLKVEGKVKSITKPDGLIIYPQNEVVGVEYTVTEDGTYTFIIVDEEGNIQAEDVIVATLSKPVLSEAITVSNYGDYVDYGIDLNDDGDTTNDWKIFYKEEDETSENYGDVFIIAADYLPASKLPTTCGFANIGSNVESSYPYGAYWNSAPNMQTNWTTNRKLFKATMYDLNSSNDNSKCVSTLLNTDNWTNFVNTDYADLAIGSPTVEMWCASWNAKGNTEITLTTDTYGYKVNDATYVSNLSTSDTLYFPRAATVEDCYGYWLASPSARDNDGLMLVNWFGNVNCIDFYNIYCYYCMRPLVHLKSGITAVQNETTGVWEL